MTNDYSRDYDKAVRFGRAPAEMITNYALQSAKNGTLDPNNSSDGPFADHLEDQYDDPRHQIVRRDLVTRAAAAEKGVPFWEANKAARREIFGNHLVSGEGKYLDEGLSTSIICSPFDGKHIIGHEVSWQPPHSRDELLPHHNKASYLAHFTPEEFDDMMEKLELPHTTKSIQDEIVNRKRHFSGVSE